MGAWPRAPIIPRSRRPGRASWVLGRRCGRCCARRAAPGGPVSMPDPRVTSRPVTRITGPTAERAEDAVAVERVLEIRVSGRALAVTLRTPGDARELALGFLAGEGLIRRRSQVAELLEIPSDCSDQPDAVELALAPGVVFDWTRLERHFAATAACGLCGRAHLESLRAGLSPIPIERRPDPEALVALPARMRDAQGAFVATGGLHARAFLAHWDADEALVLQV